MAKAAPQVHSEKMNERDVELGRVSAQDVDKEDVSARRVVYGSGRSDQPQKKDKEQFEVVLRKVQGMNRSMMIWMAVLTGLLLVLLGVTCASLALRMHSADEDGDGDGNGESGNDGNHKKESKADEDEDAEEEDEDLDLDSLEVAGLRTA